VLQNANAAMGVHHANRLFAVRDRRAFPVTRLEQKPIVDPATLAELSAN